MSLSANALYRTVSLSWNNYDASGSEYVQVFAKPSGGSWSLVLTVPVSGLDQTAEWDTALPLTAYEIAMRFVNVTVPTAGYEGVDPDLWTAPTAAQSKTTVTTTSADISGFTAAFVSASTPAALSWTCAQQNVPYLVEKNLGAGWVTVATVTANSYAYTIPAAELNTTVQFRITAKQGAVTGPTASTSLLMAIVVGTPVLAVPSFSAATKKVSLSWTAATSALSYRIEKDAGSGWTTIATVSALAYDYTISSAEANTTLSFRVTGLNGSVVGSASASQSVACTVAIGTPVLTHVPPYSWSWTAAANADWYALCFALDPADLTADRWFLHSSWVQQAGPTSTVYATGYYFMVVGAFGPAAAPLVGAPSNIIGPAPA